MTPRSHSVLKILSDGEFHSGEVVARTLGISRASVWHAVRGLEAAGVDIYTVRGRGYRLANALSLLDPIELRRRLAGGGTQLSLDLHWHVESTSTLAMARTEAGAPNGLVIAAEYQAAGRGRGGRPWHSAIGGGLTFSLLWRFNHGARHLSGLSLAVAVALVRGFQRLGVEGACVKWPNDILWNGGKIAGILIEMQGDVLGPTAAIIGIGVNVRLSETVRVRIGQPAADLESACGRPLDRNDVLARLLVDLDTVLRDFVAQGFAPFRDEWQRHHWYQRKRVTLTLPDGRRETGIARGIDADGALLVESRQGLRRYHSGEVSLRREHR